MLRSQTGFCLGSVKTAICKNSQLWLKKLRYPGQKM